MAHCAFCQEKNCPLCYYFCMIELKDIQKRLREEIKNSNLTQKEIAEKLGINPSTVSKYLRLDKFPAIDTFANICEILDVSADEILGLRK
ncbi:MAG: helix-turn-helix transcriptional regulator [Clostridiales bacterium]|nr:helix-turn-helix transcriptional regulator [Clostridiales bacterium]